MHLNPQDSKLETKEEIYTKKVLEKLGITNELLTFSNMKEPNVYMNSYEITYGKSNLYMRNLTSATSRNNSMDSSNSLTNSSNAQLNNNTNNKKFEMITHDVKQSINGTFRIVFHKLQKKMRNEYNSEEMAARQIAINEGNSTISNGTNLTLAKLEKRNYHKDSLSSRSSSRDEEYNTKYSNNNNNNINGIKQNGTIEQNGNNSSQQSAPKSIFVRLNSNPPQMNSKNIQQTNRRISEVSEASVYQIDRNRNESHKVYTNGNINSNMNGNNSRNYKYQNQSTTNGNAKQSKLCMIL